MKLKSNILLLTLIWFICGARSCSNEDTLGELKQKQLVSYSKDSIKQIFEVKQPDDKLLRAFESTAVQKLTDFADYLKIASDTSMDLSFRKHAAEMALRLFISGDINTQKWSKTCALPMYDLKTLNLLLKQSTTQGMPDWILPTKIIVSASLTAENDSIFKGRLSFYKACKSFAEADKKQNSSELTFLDIYAIKRLKSFGSEQLMIWEVYLGDFN